MWFYDVFISHASEDKETFVRALAERLRAEHLEVWFDEFTLRLGDSLRQSIDHGLARSRFGIVVLSHAFFAKQWPQRELDGLTAREIDQRNRVILPVWHGVTRKDVLDYSPPLADVLGADSASGIDAVVTRILQTIRPNGSPLIIARDELLRFGVRPPVVTDEWWLDVVEASNREPATGFVSQRRHWGRWSFPLPPEEASPQARGERLARTALQMQWEEIAEVDRICQVTPPAEVLSFIDSQPGLADVCHAYPSYLASYAPQLTVRGFGGSLEDDFDDMLTCSMEAQEIRRAKKEVSGSALSTDGLPPGCSEEIALRHPHLGYYAPAHLACQFVQGDMGGPQVKFYEAIDYIFWLLSDQSRWLPDHIRDALTRGMKEWDVWRWDGPMSGAERNLSLGKHRERGRLLEALLKAKSFRTFRLTTAARADLVGRADESRVLLRLAESAETLAERFLSEGFLEGHFAANERIARRRKSPR